MRISDWSSDVCSSDLLTDGAYHDVDSSALAFEICARGAMREAAAKSGIKLLEPIMKVEVVTPEEYLGDVIGDMNSRRGQIQGTDSRSEERRVGKECVSTGRSRWSP